MKAFIKKVAIETLLSRRKLRLAHLFILGLTVLVGGMTAFAGSHKTAPDFATFPKHPDGTVDVIIQFAKNSEAHHFAAITGQGGQLQRSLKHINSGVFRIPASMLPWLENDPDVLYVSPDRPTQPAYENEIPAVMADVARRQYGFDGTGVGVAVIDSGVYNHDDLQTPNGASRIVYAESFVAGDSNPNDAFGHGTHVAGIVGGNGFDSQNGSGYSQQFVGLAPNVNIINLRVLDGNGVGSDSQVIAAIDHAIELQSTYNIRVINLSVGRPILESYTQDPLCQAVEAAWQAGIVVVVAAGNDGRDNSMGTNGYGTIGSPANDPSVITVGATKTMGTATRWDDQIASYSSKGPTLLDHVVKPDLVAPGNQLVSLLSPGSNLATSYPTLNMVPSPVCNSGSCITGNAQYLELSGTSMATPVVAGAAALMIQQDPTLTPDTVKARMMKTAWKGYPSNSYYYDSTGAEYVAQSDIFTVGAGYLDVDRALGSTDVANGSAASVVAHFNPNLGQANIANLVNGTTIIWGNTLVWGNTIVWGNNVLTSNTLVWGASVWGNSGVISTTIVWGNSLVTGDTILWGNTIVWGDN